MTIIVFEDEIVSQLHPITLGRPAYAIACGSCRLIELLDQLALPLRAMVRPHLAPLQALDYPQLSAALPSLQHAARSNGDLIPSPSPPGPAEQWRKLPAAENLTILVNARAVPSCKLLQVFEQILRQGIPGVIRYDEYVAVAALPASCQITFSDTHLSLNGQTLHDYLQAADLSELRLESEQSEKLTVPLFRYPHDVVRFHMEIINDNLSRRLATGQYEQLRDGVFVAPGATLGEFLVTDTRQGPIVVERDASIGPYCYVSGPAHLGQRARVLEHAAIKDAVAIGHTTKIGGEVEASIIEPYTNKQHHGFLGHSYLGSWINLGAGTCNSDLKNTYGKVKMEYNGSKVDTDMQFVGCIAGDYSKSAINTGIFTGKTIGACSMMYGFVTTNVPSFVNYARLFGQVTELPPEVMVATQQRMFRRRNVQQRPCDIQLIHDIYELTQEDRQLAGEPLSF